MKYLLIFVLLAAISPAKAVELFGIKLLDASRDSFRVAVRNSGISVISEAGDDAFYDVYNSSEALQNLSRFYFGFVKKDRKFAFAEYEFRGLQQQRLLQKLNEKYGKGQKTKGKFITDTEWTWQVNAIKISLKPDWNAYKTRLIYQNPDALQRLRQEQSNFTAGINQKEIKNFDQMF